MAPIRPMQSSINERLAVLERAVEEHDEALGRFAAELSEVKDGIGNLREAMATLNATLAPMVRHYVEQIAAPRQEASGIKIGAIVAAITVALNIISAFLQHALQ